MKKIISLFILMLTTVASRAQQPQQYQLPAMFLHEFSQDSLKGFNERSAMQTVLAEGSVGSEITIRMFEMKRQYINSRYGLSSAPKTTDYNGAISVLKQAVQPGCNNEDFEASTPTAVITQPNQITGWVIEGGYNGSVPNPPLSTTAPSLAAGFPNGLQGATSCNLLGCCPLNPSKSALIDCNVPGGYIDNVIGSQYPIYSVFGSGSPNSAAGLANPQITAGMFGNKVLRLNNPQAGDYSIERLSKTFNVTAQNSIFQFAFISVFAPSHSCCDAGGMMIRILNASGGNSVIPCPNFSVSAPSGACTATVPMTYYVAGSGAVYNSSSFASTIYNPWKISSLDLTTYIGSNITIEVIVTDCTQSGHFGYVYFDAQCGPMVVYGNGTPFEADVNQVIVPTCGAAGATICAADGLGPYSWGGPNLTASQQSLSMSNQCLTTSISATYTLYMMPQGACVPIQRVVMSTITPAPLLNASILQASCGSSIAVVSVTPAGSAATPSSLVWAPLPLSMSSNSTSAQYTIPITGTAVVNVTATDPLGCKVTATAGVYPAPPIPTFAIVNNTGTYTLSCTNPTISLDAYTTYNYNGGSLSYFWASSSATFNTTQVAITTPGCYTVYALDPATNCGITDTVCVGIDNSTPSFSVGPVSQLINCNTPVQNVTITPSQTVNVISMVYLQMGGTVQASGGMTLPPPPGNHTVVVTNQINGCSTIKTFTVNQSAGFPTFDLVSAQNFTLGCGSKSFAVINIANGSSQPAGSPVSYTLIPPGQSTVLPAGSLSNASTYTVTSPGIYTVVTKDDFTFCETRTPLSIISNTFAPDIRARVDRQVLTCYDPTVTLKGLSNTNNVSFSWLTNTNPPVMPGDTLTAFTNTLASTNSLVANYTLVIVDNSSTCKSTSVVPIYQNVYRPKSVITNGGVSALSCKTTSVMLTNQSTTGIPSNTLFPVSKPVIGYLWMGPSPQDPLAESSTYLGLVPGTYTMIARDLNNGCFQATTTTIGDQRFYPIIVNPSASDLTLECGTPKLIKPEVSGPNGTAAFQYTWTLNNPAFVSDVNKKDITVTEPGEMGLIVKDANSGCESRTSMEVTTGTLIPGIEADVVDGYAPLTVNFTNRSKTTTNSTTSISTVWSFGNGSNMTIPATSSLVPSTVFNQPGTYTVTMYAQRGTCMTSTAIVITVDIPSSIEIPNVFTPNADGVNDVFHLTTSKNITEIDLTIYDRWGHVVYSVISNSGNIAWDGKNQSGKESAEGTYFYMMKATGKDGQTYEKKGTISLFR